MEDTEVHHRLAAEIAGLDLPEVIAPERHHVVLREMRFHYLDWGTRGRPPVVFLQEYALDVLAIREAEQQFVRAVFRLLMRCDRRTEDREVLGQVGPEPLGKVCHHVEALGAIDDDPAANLLRMQGTMAVLLQPFDQSIEVEAKEGLACRGFCALQRKHPYILTDARREKPVRAAFFDCRKGRRRRECGGKFLTCPKSPRAS